MVTHRKIDSPIGALTLVWDRDRCALTGLYVRPPEPDDGAPDGGGPLDDVVDRVAAYFAGEADTFDGVPLAPTGTPFQQAVWSALRAVPYGATTTYGALAEAVRRPAAARAVGTANARNPISLLVPCHRVVTAAGVPSGGGPGIRRKLWLRALERGEPAGPGS